MLLGVAGYRLLAEGLRFHSCLQRDPDWVGDRAWSEGIYGYSMQMQMHNRLHAQTHNPTKVE